MINLRTLIHFTKTGFVSFGLVYLSACQPMVGAAPIPANTLATQSAVKQAEAFWPKATLQGQNLQVAVLPAQPAEKSTAGGAVGVQIQFTSARLTESPYRLQANQPGQQAATVSNVMALRLFLIDASQGLPTGNVAPFPAAGDIFTVNTVSANQNVLFTQVPTGDYYVCAAAFSNSVGPFLSSTNLTGLGSASYGEGNVQCSNTGGDGSGSISVGSAPTYAVSNTDPLGISLNLKSATGASVELNATVTDG